MGQPKSNKLRVLFISFLFYAEVDVSCSINGEKKKEKNKTKKKEGGKEKRIETEYTTVDRTQQFSRADG